MKKDNYASDTFLAIVAVIFALICWIAFAAPARAGQWELSAGMTHATPTADGTWWQAGMPHHLTLDALSLGFDYRWRPHWMGNAWHMVAGYEDLGNFSMSAEWVPDPQYNVATKKADTSHGIEHAHGWGNVQGVYLAPEYTMHMHHGVSEDLMAGPWFYYPRTDINVPDLVYSDGVVGPQSVHTSDGIKIGYMAAMQINVGAVGARFSVFDARASQRGAAMPGLFNGPAYNASMVWRFK